MVTKDNTEIKNGQRNGRCVYIASFTRRLLRMGYKIIDVKPNHADPERTVHVFEAAEGFDEDLKNLIDKVKAARENGKTWIDNDEEFKKNDAPGRCVYIPALTRKLLRMGYEIIDVKPNHANDKKTVHVFRYTEQLDDDLKRLASEEQQRHEKSRTKIKVNEMIRGAFLDEAYNVNKAALSEEGAVNG